MILVPGRCFVFVFFFVCFFLCFFFLSLKRKATNQTKLMLVAKKCALNEDNIVVTAFVCMKFEISISNT